MVSRSRLALTLFSRADLGSLCYVDRLTYQLLIRAVGRRRRPIDDDSLSDDRCRQVHLSHQPPCQFNLKGELRLSHYSLSSYSRSCHCKAVQYTLEVSTSPMKPSTTNHPVQHSRPIPSQFFPFTCSSSADGEVMPMFHLP
jgi:hypothetical protein